IGNGLGGLGRQPLSLPRQSHPESAILVLLVLEADAADQSVRRTFETQSPVPFLAALHGRESMVAVPGKGAVGWVGPGDNPTHITHNLPVREQDLDLCSVGQFQWPQQEPRCLNRRHHKWTTPARTGL